MCQCKGEHSYPSQPAWTETTFPDTLKTSESQTRAKSCNTLCILGPKHDSVHKLDGKGWEYKKASRKYLSTYAWYSRKKSLSQRTSLWGWQPWRVTPPNLLKRKHNAPGMSQENAVRPESHFVRRTAVKSLPPASVNTIPHKRSWKDSLAGIFSLQRGWRRLGPSFPPPAKEEIKVDRQCLCSPCHWEDF